MRKLTGQQLAAAVVGGANALNGKKAEIDAMNVFPVPDGDTGINMYLTTLSAAAEADRVRDESADAVAKAAAAGALRGARGNSGVILSQIFRGFAKGLEGVGDATPGDLARAFEAAQETAYKAVMKPKEGTILTIAREAAYKAAELAGRGSDIEEIFDGVINHCEKVLMRTKDMLPALKAADVEDAGGKGFVVVLEGMYNALANYEGVTLEPFRLVDNETVDRPEVYLPMSPGAVPLGYCTELFILVDKDFDSQDELTRFLDEHGDSVVVVADDGLVKIHVHTHNPGKVLEKAISYGPIDNIKIENMRAQADAMTDKITWMDSQKPVGMAYKDTGFVAVASGRGFMDIFTSIGADIVIKGGQSANVSADEFLNAISAVPAKGVILLPNNKNVLLAARQAAALCADKEVYVVPTRNMPQGLSALTAYVHSDNAKDNAAMMEEAIKQVHTGLLTRAVRASKADGMDIAKGDNICIIDGKIALKHKNAAEAARQMAGAMITGDISFVTVYYGEGERQKNAEKLMDYIKTEFPDIECELQNGGQPLYKYIISAE